jgi:pimeloyl-ACP methyl ester carboxylesterase
MDPWEKCSLRGLFAIATLWICPAFAQPAPKPMELQQTQYQIQAGQHVPLSAPSQTLDFLSTAKTRSILTGNAKAEGLVLAPDRTGTMVLAASLRAKPGQYAVTISATSATGEVRQTALTVAVQPRTAVPSGATRNPVVLLNGWEAGFTDACPVSTSSADTFGNLAQYLVSDGAPIVYLFDNCLEDPGQTIETLGNDLGAFLNSIQFDNGTQVPQIDLVGFSMGGLIARSYLAGLQPTESLTPPATTLVGNLVLIASPNFGSFLAGNYALELPAGSQSSELIPGSAFLWNLATWNQHSDDLRGVNAIAVIGNAGTYTPSLGSATGLLNAGDGIVSLASASAGFVAEQSSVTRIVPYCHVDPSAFTNTTLGTFACNAPGIANVTDTSQLTGEIVRSFLAGTSDWTTIGGSPSADPYLSINGGMFFALLNSSGATLPM